MMFLLLTPLTLSAHSSEEFLDLVDKTKESVVFIITTPIPGSVQKLPKIAPPGEEEEDPRPNPDGKFTGTGFIVEGGYIVTNWHVIDNHESIIVYLEEDPHAYPVTLVGSDEATDIAVLKVDDTFPTVPQLKWRTKELRSGSEVFAIGHPQGLTWSVSKGIVSHLDRRIVSPWQPTLQTDTAVNKGNSGGPLLDMDGNVVGVNVMILSRVSEFNGLALAVEGRVAQRVAKTLIADGKIERPLMGVMLGFHEESYKVYAQDVVEDGAAGTAGIETNDLYLAIDGIEIVSVDDVFDVLATKQPDDIVNVKVSRDGDTKTFEVKLGRKPVED